MEKEFDTAVEYTVKVKDLRTNKVINLRLVDINVLDITKCIIESNCYPEILVTRDQIEELSKVVMFLDTISGTDSWDKE